MYPNLSAEMARKKIEQKDIAVLLNKGNSDISLRFNGKRSWLLDEAKKIKKEMFPDLSMDYLFETLSDFEEKRE